MSDAQFKIDRDLAIKENFDPFGKKWGITSRKGYGMYLIGHVTDEGTIKIPQSYPDFEGMARMEGMFTTADRAQKAISVYLEQAWEKYGIKEKQAPGKERAKQAKEEAEGAAS